MRIAAPASDLVRLIAGVAIRRAIVDGGIQNPGANSQKSRGLVLGVILPRMNRPSGRGISETDCDGQKLIWYVSNGARPSPAHWANVIALATRKFPAGIRYLKTP